MDSRSYIRSCLKEEDLWLQLAEEATELSHVAQKMARAIAGCNPTPVTMDELWDNVVEEIADVKVCMDVMNIDYDDLHLRMQQSLKVRRWAERLKQREAEARIMTNDATNIGGTQTNCGICGAEMGEGSFASMRYLFCPTCKNVEEIE